MAKGSSVFTASMQSEEDAGEYRCFMAWSGSIGTSRRVKQDSGGMSLPTEYNLFLPPSVLQTRTPQGKRAERLERGKGFRMARLLTAMVALLVMAGCGGSGGGTGGGGTGGSGPGPVPVNYSLDRNTYDNKDAVDIREDWAGDMFHRLAGNGLDLDPVTAADADEFSRKRKAIGSQGKGQYRFMGKKDKISYGQYRNGPWDTYDVEFFGEFLSLPAVLQVDLERAGKAWSLRFKKENPNAAVDSIGDTYFVKVYDSLSDMPRGCRVPPGAQALGCAGFDTTIGGRVYGQFWINPNISNPISRLRVAVHELGHTFLLGHPPGDASDPNAAINTDCTRSMSYCGLETLANPTENDFKDLKQLWEDLERMGIADVYVDLQDAYPTEPEVYGFGAWGEHTGWQTLLGRELTFHRTRTDDRLFVEARTFGTPTGSNPFTGGVTGTLTWDGSMLGADLITFDPVLGDAEIFLSAATLAGTVGFTDIKGVFNGQLYKWQSAAKQDSLSYAVKVTDTGFEASGLSGDNQLGGYFYGPNHEEVAGTFYDGAESIQGAFGGRK